MGKFKELRTRLLGGLLSMLPVSFGSYLVYEKVVLALLTGQTEERIGIVERTSEPMSFWISVAMHGLFGCLIAVFGGWGLWLSIKSWRPDNYETVSKL